MALTRLHCANVAGIQLDWFQSLKQIFIIVSYHIIIASLTLMALFLSFISYTCSLSNSDGSVLKTEPSELDWLQLYDMTH